MPNLAGSNYGQSISSVTEAPSVGDPGDDTARRFRYQYEYTAALLCALIEENAKHVEVFCEHHEDVVIRDTSDKCCGVQIKTRELGLELWKATDEDLVAALAKFARKDNEFPGSFGRFRLVTNHQFWAQKDNGKNVAHLLKCAKDVTQLPSGGILRSFLRAIAKKAKLSEDAVLSTLKKTEVWHHAPKLRDSLSSVSESLRTSHAGCGEASANKLREISRALSFEVFRAASLDHEQSLSAYMVLEADPGAAAAKAKIAAKRFDRNRVLRIVEEQLAPEALALLGNPDETQPPANQPSATESKLAKKLDAGELSATTAYFALDCWASALHQHVRWQNRLGAEKAMERHTHIRSVALAEASAAYEESADGANPFGRRMLQNLRLRIQQRRQSMTEFFGLDDEHVLGHVFMLTEECKVWWSKQFLL